MAQLNDLLVLGNTSLVGDVNLSSNLNISGETTSLKFIGPLEGNATSADTAPWSGISNKPNYYDAKAIKSITRSGTTFTATHMDGTTTTFTQKDDNTDTKVTQSASTTSSYRHLLLHYSTGTSPDSTTGQVYYAANIYAKPSDGTLYATKFSGNLTGNVTGNLTGNVTGNLTGNVTGSVSGTSGGLNSNVSSIELNSGGTLPSYGGFIDFHFHNADKKPLNASGTVVSATPDYTSRIIEDVAGQISINSVKFKNNTVTATTFTGALNGNATSATKLYATKTIAANAQYFPMFVSGNSSGNKDAYIHSRYYYWDTGTRAHLCIGEQGTSTTDATGAYSGGITINSGSGKGKYVDIIPAAMTKYNQITIPDESGTLALRERDNTFTGFNTFTKGISIGSSKQADTTAPQAGITIHDLRNVTPAGGMFGEKRLNFYFDQVTDKFGGATANSSRWMSIMHMSGWTNTYASWELAGNAQNDSADDTLRYRQGIGTNWGAWQSVLTDANYHIYTDGRYVNVTGDTMTGNLNIKGTNPYLGFMNSSGTVVGYAQYVQSDNYYALGAGVANSIQIDSTGNTSIPGSKNFTPRTTQTGSLGTTSNVWKTGYINNLHLYGDAIATMTAASTNPKITFSAKGVQPVHIIYTHQDSYRQPAGLKVVGGTDATPAWFEVEGAIHAGGNIITSNGSNSVTLQNDGGIYINANASGGWARSIKWGNNNTTKVQLGAFGDGATLNYLYIGSAYNSTWMKVDSNSNVTATTFTGALSGNASSATKATQDGSGNTITSTYLKLSGGTMTGVLTAKGGMYEDAYNGALNMNNSDIYGVNSIYTSDLSDSPAEGIHFYRTATTVDTIWVKNGVMSFTPNRTLGASGTSETVLHTGNSGGVFYVTGNSGGTAGTWTGTNTNIPRLYQGLTIAYKILTAGASTTTLNLTTAAGASGAITVKRANGNLTTHLAVNSVVVLVYDGTYWRWADYSTSDTKNTAGTTNSTSILYLAGATSQAANPKTYSHSAIKANCNSAGTNEAGSLTATKVYGAIWNDYAEYRNQIDYVEPGYCIASTDDGRVYKTTEKFQACDGIVSDTFGFSIGETLTCKTPIAVAGRVLAYCEGNRYDYHAGDTVCAGPEGKVCKMTREEICKYPDRIIGIVSEIPMYDEWGTGNIKVNNRIWIKIK